VCRLKGWTHFDPAQEGPVRREIMETTYRIAVISIQILPTPTRRQYLDQKYNKSNKEEQTRIGLLRPPPIPKTALISLENSRTGRSGMFRERKSPIIDAVQSTAIKAILDRSNSLLVLLCPQQLPSLIKTTS
jgi:hypothetical protein